MAVPVLAHSHLAASSANPVTSLGTTMSGAASGHLLLLWAHVMAASSVPAVLTVPSGFTLVRQEQNTRDVQFALYSKISDGSENGTLTVTTDQTNTTAMLVGCARITGQAASSPIHVIGVSASSGNQSAVTWANLTTTLADCLILRGLAFMVQAANANQVSVTSGYTEAFDAHSTNAANARRGMALQHKNFAAAGSTGAESATLDIAKLWQSISIAVTGASGGGGGGTITSGAAGNWSNTGTWIGGVVPGPTNDVVLDHNVTVDTDVVVGTSGATGTAAITMNTANRVLTVNAGCRLTLRGDLIIKGTFGTLTWCLDVLAGGELEFDSSQAASPSGTNYCVRPSVGGTGASVRFQGTVSNPCTVLSNAGGGNGWFSRGGFTGHGQFSATYTDFTRIGDATRAFVEVFYGSNGATGGQSTTLDHCICDGGAFPTFANSPNGGFIDYQFTTWRNSLPSTFNVPAFTIAGTKNLKECVIDKEVGLANGAWDIGGTLFLNGVSIGSRSVKAVQNSPCFIRKTSQPTINGWGDLKDSYYLKDVTPGEFTNPHFWAMPAWADTEVSGCVFEYNGSGVNGDCLSQSVPSVARISTIKNNLFLGNDDGNPLGKMCSLGGASNESIVIEHNTYISNVGSTTDAETGCQWGETGAEPTITSFKSNLAWCATANRALLLGRFGGTVQNVCAVANIVKNATWNGYTGTDGVGYDSISAGTAFTSDPDTTDVAVASDPFVDRTRNFAAWDASNGGDGTALHGVEEMAKKNDRSGFNTNYTVSALLAWVKDGFKVTSTTLRDAGHDGVTIGALPYQAPGGGGGGSLAPRFHTTGPVVARSRTAYRRRQQVLYAARFDENLFIEGPITVTAGTATASTALQLPNVIEAGIPPIPPPPPVPEIFHPPVLYLSAPTLPRCRAGWKPLYYIPDAVQVRERESTDLDEWATFLVPPEGASLAQVAERRILGVVRETGTGVGAYREYRISEVERVRHPEERMVRVRARGLAFDLVDCGPIVYWTSGGSASMAVTAELTPAQWIDTYILPTLAAAGYDYYARGTVTIDLPVALSFTGWTPMQVLRELAQRLRVDAYVRRNGATNYLLDLGTLSSGTSVRIADGKNILSHRVRADTMEQATILIPTGALGASDRQRSIAALRYKVTAVDTGTDRLTLAAPDGDSGKAPILYDDEWNGRRLFRIPLGAVDLIVDSFAATQQVQIADVEASGYAVGDFIEVRENAGSALTLHVAQAAALGYDIAIAGAPSGSTIPMTLLYGASSGVVLDDAVKHLMLRGAPLQHVTTTTAFAAPDTVALATSTANVAVGDVGFFAIGSTAPFFTPNAGLQPFLVTEILDAARVRVRRLGSDAAAIGLTGPNSFAVRFYRPRAGATRITASHIEATGASGTLGVYSLAASGIVTNDLLLVYADIGGYRERLTIHSPAHVALYGPKAREFARGDRRGSVNLAMHFDPWFEQWTSATQLAQYTGAAVRVDAATIGGLYGVYCVGLTTHTITAKSGVRVVPGGERTVTLRLRLRTGATWLSLTNGSVVVSLYGLSYKMIPPGGSASGTHLGAVELSAAATWYDLTLAYPLSAPSSTQDDILLGAPLQVVATGTDVALDAVQIELGTGDPGHYTRYGDAYDLHRDAARWYAQYGVPPAQYELAVVDLRRAAPDLFANDRIDLGATAVLEDGVLGVSESLAVVAVETNHEKREDTLVTLNSVRDTLTRLLSG